MAPTPRAPKSRHVRVFVVLVRRLEAALLLLPAVLLVLPGALPAASSQHLPTRDEDNFRFQISHAELFYDTKLLPDGAEVTTFLHQGLWRKFFFMVEYGDTPVSFIITPCASAIDWRLSLHDLPEGASGEGTDADDLFDQMEVSATVAPPDGNILQTYSGHHAQTFTIADCPPGVLMLEMRARDRHASVKMYTTTTPHSDQPYPLLPNDAEVRVTGVAKHSLTLSWKGSPTSERFGQPVEYCVSANKQSSFFTQCAVLAEVDNEEPPTAPPNSGFGFAWEREQRREQEELFVHPESEQRDDIEYICIGGKQSYTFSSLRAGQLYYFDVFVVSKNTNRSSTYFGVIAQTLAYEKMIPLKDGKLVTSHVKRSRGQKIFHFTPMPGAELIVFSVQPCAGRLDVEISNAQGIVAQKSIRELWKVVLNNVTRGPYLIRVAPKRHRSVSFKVFASTSLARYPYPVLAEDTAIRAFDRQRGCSSMVVAWLGTDRRLQYCLFIREVSKTSSGISIARLFKESNRCVSNSNRKKGEKVMCRSFRYKNPRRSVITETVRGLKPNTRYAIDVYARRPGRESLSYQTTWASTRSQC